MKSAATTVASDATPHDLAVAARATEHQTQSYGRERAGRFTCCII